MAALSVKSFMFFVILNSI